MSYKNVAHRTIHTGLYTDKAAKLVKKVLAVCVPSLPSSTTYAMALREALRMNSSVYRDPSGEVVISNADHCMYDNWSKTIYEDDKFKSSLRGLTDTQILKYIAKVLKSTMTKYSSPEYWRFDNTMRFKDEQSFYRCYPHIDPLMYIDDNGDYDYDDSCCLVQNVTLSFKDAYFIWAKFNDNEKELKKFSKSYAKKIIGEPNNIVKYEALKAIEDETVDLIDNLISRKRDLMHAEKAERKNAENAVIAAFDIKHKELNREFTEKYNAIKEIAKI